MFCLEERIPANRLFLSRSWKFKVTHVPCGGGGRGEGNPMSGHQRSASCTSRGGGYGCSEEIQKGRTLTRGGGGCSISQNILSEHVLPSSTQSLLLHPTVYFILRLGLLKWSFHFQLLMSSCIISLVFHFIFRFAFTKALLCNHRQF